nr:immunoglobulin light chain junction region [Macaca mulatta]
DYYCLIRHDNGWVF